LFKKDYDKANFSKENKANFSIEISPRIAKDSLVKEVNKEYFNSKPVKKWKQNGNDKMLKNLRSISNPRLPKD